jgi:ribosome maturation factor RimP
MAILALISEFEQSLKVGLVPIFCFRRMYRQNKHLVELIDPVVRALGYEMLGIEHLTRGHESLLRIYIDNEVGIRLDDCERVSRQVTGLLDVHEPIKGAYTLEVSSPGFDRPLFTLDHFRRFVGHPVRVQLHEKTDGHRKFAGMIKAVHDDSIEVHVAGTDYMVKADNIEKARLVAE